MKRAFIALAAAALLAFSIAGSRQLEVRADVYSKDKENVVRELATRLDASGRVHLIVGLDAAFSPEGNLKDDEVSNQRRSIRAAQRIIIDDYAGLGADNIKEFDYIPYVAFEANKDALQALITDRRITFVQEDIASAPALAESIPIVSAPAAWSAGYSGSGQVVAIVDSGVDKNHTFLAGKVISEACYSSNNSSSTSFCPGGATESIAAGSGVNCPSNVSGCDHGTHVAGIAAGKSATINGVAKDANIIAVQIFSSFTSSSSCGANIPCARYWTSDLIKGLERVRTLSATIPNIAAVNLSLQTGQQYTSNCDIAHSATKAAIDNLRSVGIPTVVCAGNYSFTDSLTAPACISTSISVGSVDDGSNGTATDVVSSFSDSSPLLHVLAPGRWINSSVPGNGFANFSGTSMATPHVVGAIAVMRQKSPAASVPRLINALVRTGSSITDTRNSIVKPRLNVGAAVNLVAKNTAADFDGDGKTDTSLFRPSDGNWYLNRSRDGSAVLNWGNITDIPTPADFDNDGKADVAVFRPSTGQWLILRSSDSGFIAANWGGIGDEPVPGDYDGDGKADIAVYRPSNGTWYMLKSSNNQDDTVQWGSPEDLEVRGDWDGDKRTDIAVYRPSNGNWFVLQSSGGGWYAPWGTVIDKPVPADFDGDGKMDMVVYRPTDGNWYIYRSGGSGQYDVINWGNGSDTPVPGDYDGDGKSDIAQFRPSSGQWFILKTTGGYDVVNWGANGDKPAPASYVP